MLDVGTTLMRRWWSVTFRSKNVSVVRRYWIFQVTRVILVRTNPKSSRGDSQVSKRPYFSLSKLSSVEAKRRMNFRRCSLVKEEAHQEGESNTQAGKAKPRKPESQQQRNNPKCGLLREVVRRSRGRAMFYLYTSRMLMTRGKGVEERDLGFPETSA
ncbi:hypothetical protein E5676_scaffold1415G00500 [Cucumis melo var. makuwa]|uniref:Uncharacterized protein n=1 Tax=Cucumis melo var. makuwa TaxID=1194695 RepID=A0A5D3BZT1_CUCMM|nr:hypothetical protein E6C27_scaffold616G001090 [Cucumis melo var. makuwa]TYK05181.1 hypothetical protein E5676_scaffold1415G00500 [Cucumis melo var. makuwa]